jgi:hypothetical protein
VGPDFYGGAALTALLLAAMVTRHLAFTVSHTLFCFGHERSLAVSGLADGAFTVGGTWLLIRLLGPLGVPLGSLAGVLLIGLPVNLYLLAKATDASPLSLLRSHLPWLWRFLALIAVLGAGGQVWKPQGFLALAATAVGVLGLYALVMFPMVRRSLLWPFFQPQVASLRTKLGMLRT